MLLNLDQSKIVSFGKELIVSHVEVNSIKDKNVNQLQSLPDDKILDLSKHKTFADDKSIVYQMVELGHDRLENIVGKRKKCL